MKISNLLVVLLIAGQLSQVMGTSRLSFNVNKANAFLNAGDCYINPGISVPSFSQSSSKGRIGLKYYDLPYGWSQYKDRITVPKLLSQKGDWIFGAKMTDEDDFINEQFKISIRGLEVKISPVAGSVTNNIVIGSNYRSEGVSDDDWNDFSSSLSSDSRKYLDDSGYYYWDSDKRSGSKSSDDKKNIRGNITSSSSSSGSGSGSSSSPSRVVISGSGSGSSPSRVVITGSGSSKGSILDNLISRESDDDIMTSIILGHSTPSQVVNTVRTTTTSSSSGTDSDARRIALNNQYNANRVLNEVTSLVTQLTSNVDSTTALVTRLESEISGVKTGSSQCNDKILELNAAKVKAEATITAINDKVREYRTKLNDFTPALNGLLNKRNQLVQTRLTYERSQTPNSNLLSQLETRYTTCNAQIDGIKGDYAKVKSSIDENTNKITTIENSAADAPNQITLAKEQIKVVDSTIADLEAKLSEARAQKAKLQTDINGYNDLVRTSTIQVSTLKNLNSRLTSQLSSLQSSVDSQVIKCSAYQKQSDDIRAEIASKQKDYDALVKQIEVQDSLIANKRSEIERFQTETSSLPSQISTLQSDLLSAQTALSRQYFICSQTTDSFTRADNDLRAARLRLETERKFLTDAQARLATAKTQKANADDVVNKILSTVTTGGSTTTTTTTTGGSTGGSTVIITGGSGSTGGSTVIGGGSGSGSTIITGGSGSGSTGSVIIGGGSSSLGGISGILGGSTGISGGSTLPSNVLVYGIGPVAVGSISDYIGRVYGPTVKSFWDPYALSSASTYSTMYPISSTTLSALYGRSGAGIFLPQGSSYLSGISDSVIGSSRIPSNIIGDFNCGGAGSVFGSSSSANDLISGYGKITSVQPGYITVATPTNQSYNLRIGGCSRLEATRPEFVASTLDPVFFRGSRGLNGDVHLYDLTCLS